MTDTTDRLSAVDARPEPPSGRQSRHALAPDLLFGRLIPAAIGMSTWKDRPLPSPLVMAPHLTSRTHGVAHYNVLIPDLPAPHHFLATAAIIGLPGIRAFDIDHAIQDSPRHTATLAHGTAAATENSFKAYSTREDLKANKDGSLVRFGEDLTLSGLYPDFQLRSSRPGFAADLDFTCTGEITWYTRSPVYTHYTLLARYTGTITTPDAITPVAGLGCVEYATGTTPYQVWNRPIPSRLKLPWDFFTYQVMNLDPDTQLVMTHSMASGHHFQTGAGLRRAGERAARVGHDIRYEVLSLQPEPLVAPDGRRTYVPDTLSWQYRDERGRLFLEFEATVDTPMIYGIGTGWIGGYRYEGQYHGNPITGRGYLEYVDRRND